MRDLSLSAKKSSHSLPKNPLQCLHVGRKSDGTVYMFDSKNPERTIECSRDDLKAFLDGAKDGEFDEYAR